MASITHHLSTNLVYNNEYSKYEGEDLIRFLVGAIAPDSARAGGGKDIDQKNISHFLTKVGTRDMNAKFSLENEVPEVDLFVEKYKENLNDPFVLGYLIHLVTDSYWFSEVLISCIQKRIKDIKSSARNLNEVTMGEALNWYKENVFKMFDYHDSVLSSNLNSDLINKISNFNVEKCPIEEVNKEDLKNLLTNLPQKYNKQEVAEKSDLISILEIKDFFTKSSQLAFNLYQNNIQPKHTIKKS